MKRSKCIRTVVSLVLMFLLVLSGMAGAGATSTSTATQSEFIYETQINGNIYTFRQSSLAVLAGSGSTVEVTLTKNNLPLVGARIEPSDRSTPYYTDSQGKSLLQRFQTSYGYQFYSVYDGIAYIGNMVVIIAEEDSAVVRYTVVDENQEEGTVWNFTPNCDVLTGMSTTLVRGVRLVVLIVNPLNDTSIALNGSFRDRSLFSFYEELPANSLQPFGVSPSVYEVVVQADDAVKIDLANSGGSIDGRPLIYSSLIVAPKINSFNEVDLMDSGYSTAPYMYLSAAEYHVAVSGYAGDQKAYLLTDGMTVDHSVYSINIAQNSVDICRANAEPYNSDNWPEPSLFHSWQFKGNGYKIRADQNHVLMTKGIVTIDQLTLDLGNNSRIELYVDNASVLNADTVVRYGGQFTIGNMQLDGVLEVGQQIRLIPRISDSYGNYLEMYNIDGYPQHWLVTIKDGDTVVYDTHDKLPHRTSYYYWYPSYSADYTLQYTMDLGSYGILSHTQNVFIQDRVVVEFQDAALETAVRQALGKEYGDITATDMAGLTSLTAYHAGVSNLVGLEYAVNLTDLRIGGNNISDLRPLSQLANLNTLDVFGNIIEDITPLQGLTNLRSLALAHNLITDISPLSKLINLNHLTIQDNQVSDISALANLLNLNILCVMENLITDITPLVLNSNNGGLSTGDYVNLPYNYLDLRTGSQNMTDIQTLIDRGVTVNYEPQLFVPVTGVTLDQTYLMLSAGDSALLSATVLPVDATNKNVIWSSSDESVATVVDGLVMAASPGIAIITVTTVDGGFTANCFIIVNNGKGSKAK